MECSRSIHSVHISHVENERVGQVAVGLLGGVVLVEAIQLQSSQTLYALLAISLVLVSKIGEHTFELSRVSKVQIFSEANDHDTRDVLFGLWVLVDGLPGVCPRNATLCNTTSR